MQKGEKDQFAALIQLFLKKRKKVLLSFTLFFLKSVSLYENKNVRFFWLESATRKWTNEN
ncbi:hypothetical protein GKD52_09765 [Odoribacter splanchnicus]|nr:hypothetical protein [Odoribacter splanchnicus]